MCSEPAMRAPRSGCSGANSSRIAMRPGISVSAIAISLRPQSASARSATLKVGEALGFVGSVHRSLLVGDRAGEGRRETRSSPRARARFNERGCSGELPSLAPARQGAAVATLLGRRQILPNSPKTCAFAAPQKPDESRNNRWLQLRRNERPDRATIPSVNVTGSFDPMPPNERAAGPRRSRPRLTKDGCAPPRAGCGCGRPRSSSLPRSPRGCGTGPAGAAAEPPAAGAPGAAGGPMLRPARCRWSPHRSRKGSIDVYLNALGTVTPAQRRDREAARRRAADAGRVHRGAGREGRRPCWPRSIRARSKSARAGAGADGEGPGAAQERAGRPRALSNAARAGFDREAAGRHAGSARPPVRGHDQGRPGGDRQREAAAHLQPRHRADQRTRRACARSIRATSCTRPMPTASSSSRSCSRSPSSIPIPEDNLPQVLRRLTTGEAVAVEAWDRDQKSEARDRQAADGRQPDRHDDRHGQAQGRVRERRSRAVSEPVRQHPDAGRDDGRRDARSRRPRSSAARPARSSTSSSTTRR